MDTLRAILLMVLSMALLAASDAFLKLASQHAPVGQVMLMLSIGATLLFVALARLRRVSLNVADAFHRKVMLRNICEMAGALGMIVGLSKIPLSLMAAIMQTAPLVVTLGAALFLGEPVGWRRWLAIAVGLVGMLMVIRPGGSGFTGWEIFPVAGVTGLAARDQGDHRRGQPGVGDQAARRTLHAPLTRRRLRRRRAAPAEPVRARPLDDLHRPPGGHPLALGRSAEVAEEVECRPVRRILGLGGHVDSPPGVTFDDADDVSFPRVIGEFGVDEHRRADHVDVAVPAGVIGRSDVECGVEVGRIRNGVRLRVHRVHA